MLTNEQIKDAVIRILEASGLRNYSSGNEVRFECPNPDCKKDGELKYYFNVDKQKGHCFRCSEKAGSLKSLLSRVLLHMSGQEVAILVRDTLTRVADGASDSAASSLLLAGYGARPDKAKLPDPEPSPLPEHCLKLIGASTELASIVQQYLRGRHFNSEGIQILDPYYSYHWPDSVVLPVKLGGEVVFWTRRIFSRSTGIRYMSPPTERDGRTFYGKSQVLWGYDDYRQGDHIILCEGIFDAAKLCQFGFRALALFGNKISDTQRSMLLEKPPSQITIILDGEERVLARALGMELRDFFGKVCLIQLPGFMDPAELKNVEECSLLLEFQMNSMLKTVRPVICS